jgi:hypothetical protein
MKKMTLKVSSEKYMKFSVKVEIRLFWGKWNSSHFIPHPRARDMPNRCGRAQAMN